MPWVSGITVASAPGTGDLRRRLQPDHQAYLRATAVSYTVEIKQKGIRAFQKRHLTNRPVSEPCAAQMASGVRDVIGSDIAVSVARE